MSRDKLRKSGYVSRSQELWYGVSSPFYDAMTMWCFLPLGGERRCREWIVDSVDPQPGQNVLSLCCGTGTTDRALLQRVPSLQLTGVDAGAGQVATAQRKNKDGSIRYVVGDASSTGLPGSTFNRVLISLALHEMPRKLRLAVLREARRVCTRDGTVIAVEHATMAPGSSKLMRDLWWLTLLPGNPERLTTKDLQRRGLENEMHEAGLEVLDHRFTTPSWIEAVIGRPS